MFCRGGNEAKQGDRGHQLGLSASQPSVLTVVTVAVSGSKCGGLLYQVGILVVLSGHFTTQNSARFVKQKCQVCSAKVPALFSKSAKFVQQKCQVCSAKVPDLFSKSARFVQQKCQVCSTRKASLLLKGKN